MQVNYPLNFFKNYVQGHLWNVSSWLQGIFFPTRIFKGNLNDCSAIFIVCTNASVIFPWGRWHCLDWWGSKLYYIPESLLGEEKFQSLHPSRQALVESLLCISWVHEYLKFKWKTKIIHRNSLETKIDELMNNLRQEWIKLRLYLMHCKMSRLDESKAMKGRFVCEIDIYWASRSITSTCTLI